jgi:6,7-dimethyl-8-ribityllumazine synthase
MRKDNSPLNPMIAKKEYSIAVIAAEFNEKFSDTLLEYCVEGLLNSGIPDKKVEIFRVPGSFELPFAAKKMAKSKKYDGVICLGVIIRGETNHFELVSECTAKGIMEVNIQSPVPIIFGVLSCENIRQAKNRLYLGEEYARTAVQMMNMNGEA